jgi:outer membrane lipoprotein carrier protein
VHYYLAVLSAAFFLLDLSPAIQKFESTYHNARTLRAHFLESYSENGKIVRTEAGTAYFRRPGKMRWEYEQPEKNLFLVDGKNTWFYAPSDHTATRIPVRQSDDWRAPMALLAGEGKLSKVCARVVSAIMPASGAERLGSTNSTAFECVLKSASPILNLAANSELPPRVFLEITETGELARVIIQSSGSVLTEFRFKDWEINPPLAEVLFRFDPPPGVVIVDGLLPSASSTRP